VSGVLLWSMPLLGRLFLAWQHHVNGFELARRDEEARTFVFRCSHFDAASRSCDSYESRPGMCRDYPRALLAQPDPEFFPQCGYRPVARNAARLVGELERRGIAPETVGEIKRRLRLE
jgi:hypothetical protein